MTRIFQGIWDRSSVFTEISWELWHLISLAEIFGGAYKNILVTTEKTAWKEGKKTKASNSLLLM